jgi:hypothetical protein
MKRSIASLLIAGSTFIIGIAAFQIADYTESLVLNWVFGTPQLNKPAVDSPDAVLLAEQEIYRTLLREMFVSEGAKLLVIESQTTGCDIFEDPAGALRIGANEDFNTSVKRMLPMVENSTIDDYLGKNKTIGTLFLSDIGFDYVLIGHEAAGHFFESNVGRGWTEFYEKYPKSNGLIYFSKIGLNNQRDQALVYAGRSCGGLCGSGDYVLLKKQQDKWVIEQKVMLWIS